MKKAHFHSNTYQLAIRYRLNSGGWSDWQDKGTGQWIGIEHVQDQIKMIRKAYLKKGIQIIFKYEEKYLDYLGNEIGKPIDYDTK